MIILVFYVIGLTYMLGNTIKKANSVDSIGFPTNSCSILGVIVLELEDGIIHGAKVCIR